MCGVAKEVGHHVVGRVAVGACGVIAVGLEPRAVAGSDLGKGDSVIPGRSSCSVWSIGRGGAICTLLGA